ncbi:MAG: isoprenoid biosynthesis glyoxalase ElbB [Bdellovibrionaceae bacterium]|nr:isoprenoid biosynthesis glyoxalase ElbB [Pseudobdellovibrionaceae bacterium]
MKKIAVVLSGSGYLDGTEITEAVSFLIALGQAGAQVRCFAPDMDAPAVDHVAKKPLAGETRNVLREAARIARSEISELRELRAADFDAVVFPGGFGVAKNLCDWAQKGAQSSVHPEIERVIREFHGASKPIGAACIAPVLLAKVLGKKRVALTIGDDAATADEIKKTGAHHEDCPVDDYVTDRENKVITTPAYMYEAKPHEVFQGISGLVKELVEMA